MSQVKNKYNFVEFAELRVGEDKETKEPYNYIKITKDVTLPKGTVVTSEEPKAKFERMLKSDRLDAKAKAEVQEQLDNLPSYILKRLIARIPK